MYDTHHAHITHRYKPKESGGRVAGWKRALRARLPPYMIPSVFRCVTVFERANHWLCECKSHTIFSDSLVRS